MIESNNQPLLIRRLEYKSYLARIYLDHSSEVTTPDGTTHTPYMVKVIDRYDGHETVVKTLRNVIGTGNYRDIEDLAMRVIDELVRQPVPAAPPPTTILTLSDTGDLKTVFIATVGSETWYAAEDGHLCFKPREPLIGGASTTEIVMDKRFLSLDPIESAEKLRTVVELESQDKAPPVFINETVGPLLSMQCAIDNHLWIAIRHTTAVCRVIRSPDDSPHLIDLSGLTGYLVTPDNLHVRINSLRCLRRFAMDHYRNKELS